MANQNIDFAQSGATADTGEADATAIKPIIQGEAATALVLGRPDENLRTRTEVIRAALEEAKYLADADRILLLAGGGTITWAGIHPGQSGGFTITEDIVVKPFLAPATSTQARHTIGDDASREVVISTIPATVGPVNPPRAYSGANKISFNVSSDDTGDSVAQISVDGTPEDNFTIVVDDNVTTGTTCTQLMNALNANADFIAAGLVAALGPTTVGSNKVSGTDGETYFLSGAADAEKHIITAAGLVTFFTTVANRMVEGDVLCIGYDELVNDSVYTGRRQSIPDSPEASTNADSNLFLLRNNPEKLTHAIPVATVYAGDLILINNSKFKPGVSDTLAGSYYAGSNAWADGTFVTAGSVESAIDEVVADLAGTSGAAKIGYAGSGNWADGTQVTADDVESAIDEVVSDLAATAGAGRIGAAFSQTWANATDTSGNTVAAALNNVAAALAATGGAGKIGSAATGSVSATNVQAAIAELASEKVQAATLAATGGAATVGFNPSGILASTTVQGAIDELANEQVNTVNLAASGGAAMVGNLAAGNISASTVQAALNELDSEKAGLTLANIFTLLNSFNAGIKTGAGSVLTPHFRSDQRPPGGQLRFLISEYHLHSGLGNKARFYAAESGGGGRFEITINAAWNGTHWVADQAGNAAIFAFDGYNLGTARRVGATAGSSWTDAQWTAASEVDLQVGAISARSLNTQGGQVNAGNLVGSYLNVGGGWVDAGNINLGAGALHAGRTHLSYNPGLKENVGNVMTAMHVPKCWVSWTSPTFGSPIIRDGMNLRNVASPVQYSGTACTIYFENWFPGGAYFVLCNGVFYDSFTNTYASFSPEIARSDGQCVISLRATGGTGSYTWFFGSLHFDVMIYGRK